MSDFDGSPSPMPPSPPRETHSPSVSFGPRTQGQGLPLAYSQRDVADDLLKGGLIISSKSPGQSRAPRTSRKLPPALPTPPTNQPPLGALEPIIRVPPGLEPTFPFSPSPTRQQGQYLRSAGPKSKVRLDSLGCLVTDQEELISGTVRSASVPKDSSFDPRGLHVLSSEKSKAFGLPPSKQRAAQILSSISPSTISKSPSFTPSSVMASALSYALPPQSIVSGFIFPSAAPISHNPAASGVLHLTLSKDHSALLSQPGLKLPFQSRNPLHLTATTPNAAPTTHMSMQGAYAFDVPKEVRTGIDAVKLFSSSAAKPGLLVYCNLADPSGRDTFGYNPYDLVVVLPEEADPSLHFVISQSGVTQIKDSQGR